jgi:GrpB-like predicted nucleotidyltransferase (UPF0157 family)
MEKYVFRKYDDEYRNFFKVEKKLLARLEPIAKIEHVGSTAVLGLGGKGILDIAIGVPKSRIAETKNKLEKSGYEFREKAGTPDRLFFMKDYTSKARNRRVHIHLTDLDGKDWEEMKFFRDYLLEHPEAVGKYARVKKDAARKAAGDGRAYGKCKETFIKRVLVKMSH